MTTQHDRAVKAALADWSKSDDKYLSREETMRRAIAAFLRAWEPSDACTTQASHKLIGRAFAEVTADELEQP